MKTLPFSAGPHLTQVKLDDLERKLEREWNRSHRLFIEMSDNIIGAMSSLPPQSVFELIERFLPKTPNKSLVGIYEAMLMASDIDLQEPLGRRFLDAAMSGPLGEGKTLMVELSKFNISSPALNDDGLSSLTWRLAYQWAIKNGQGKHDVGDLIELEIFPAARRAMLFNDMGVFQAMTINPKRRRETPLVLKWVAWCLIIKKPKELEKTRALAWTSS